MAKATAERNTWAESMKNARIEQIITAASKVFEERGLDGASVRQIASAAGCTTGVIYPLFKSKDEIYAELLDRALVDLKTRMEDAIGKEKDAEGRLRVGSRVVLDYYLKRPSHFGLAFYLTGGLKRMGLGPELNRRLNERLSEIAGIQDRDLAEVVGPDRAPAEAASLFAHITGLLMLQLRGRFNVFEGEPHTMLETYLDRLLQKETRHE